MTDSTVVPFADGPLAHREASYWAATSTLEGPWPGRYELAMVVDPETMRVSYEYRYNATWKRG